MNSSVSNPLIRVKLYPLLFLWFTAFMKKTAALMERLILDSIGERNLDIFFINVDQKQECVHLMMSNLIIRLRDVEGIMEILGVCLSN